MATKRIYLSPSNQEDNYGVNGYNEEKYMHILVDKVADILRKSPMFYVRISDPSWSLQKVVQDSNEYSSDLHICLHSDAFSDLNAKGTTVFFHKANTPSEKFANLLYSKVSTLSPGKDRGTRARPELYELSNTNCPAVLIELFFHTNTEEVNHFLNNINVYAEAIAKAIYEFYSVPFDINVGFTLADAVRKCNSVGIIKSPDYWIANNEYDGKFVRQLIISFANYIAKEWQKNGK